MKLPSGLARLLSADADYAPFGIALLRGLTPGRVGLAVLLCATQAVRRSTSFIGDGEFAEFLVHFSRELPMQFVGLVPMLLLVTVADNLSAAASNVRRIAALATAVLVGAALYAVAYNGLLLALFGPMFEDPNDPARNDPLKYTLLLAGYAVRMLLYGGLLTTVLYFVTRERAATQALHATRMAQVDLDRQTSEARLAMLQAQIEPHFLFNTLANVKRLYLTDPARGREMLANLSAYLRAALPQMRESGTTLGRELALARAYLKVQQVRMGERLKVEIAVPDELLAANLPPMMLATLVENAVKHALAPRPTGGTLRIAARRLGERIEVSVSDDGVGFQKRSGTGVGLANTRARLASLYGTDARLALAGNPAGGVTATLSLPDVNSGRLAS